MEENPQKEEMPVKKPSGFKSCAIVFAILLVLFIGLMVGLNLLNSWADKKISDSSSTAQTTAPVATLVPEPSNTDLLAYFSAIAFADSTSGSAITITRWNRALISVEITGSYGPTESNKLDEFINGFNAISISTKLSRVTESGNIVIDYEPRAVLAKKISDPNLLARDYYAWANSSGGSTLTSANIYIQNDQIANPLLIDFTLAHEMTHALGFRGHDPGGHGCNAMTNVPCGPLVYFTAYDEFAYKVMYNTGIPAGIGETAGISYVNAHWPSN